MVYALNSVAKQFSQDVVVLDFFLNYTNETLKKSVDNCKIASSNLDYHIVGQKVNEDNFNGGFDILASYGISKDLMGSSSGTALLITPHKNIASSVKNTNKEKLFEIINEHLSQTSINNTSNKEHLSVNLISLSNGKIQLRNMTKGMYNLTLFSANGKMISMKRKSVVNHITLDYSNLNSGVYFLKGELGSRVFDKMFVVK